MKKITISEEDLLSLFCCDKTKKHAIYIIENCKNSKYGYGSEEYKKCQVFYFLEVDDKFLKSLYELLTKDIAGELVTMTFIIQLLRKIKSKNEETEGDLF